jgi:hypothetical protein
MKAFRFSVLGLLLWSLGGLVLSSAPCRAELDLSVSLPRTQYLLDEPVFVKITLANTGGQKASALRSLDPSFGILHFEICGPGEEVFRDYRPLMQATLLKDNLENLAIELAPAGRYDETVDMTYEMRGPRAQTLLSQAGEYILRARYDIPGDWPSGPKSLISNEVKLTAAEPEGNDALARQLLYDCKLPFELRPWNAFKHQQASYEKVLKEYPESRYANPVRFHLAQVYEFQGEQALRGTSEGKQMLAKAAALQLAVSQTAGDTPLGLTAKRLAARAYAKIGDAAKAQELLQQVSVADAATQGDKLIVESWLGHVKSGEFEQAGGQAKAQP